MSMWQWKKIQTMLWQKIKRGENVVELDQFKSVLNSYEKPLNELRDSL